MGKPGTIIGAGGRAGTARAQMQLLETLGETGTIVMIKPGVLIAAFAPDTFDSEGNLISPDMRQLLAKHMEEFGKWIMHVGMPRDFVRFACEMDIQLAAR
jgi:NAD(P)H-dependent FMN reductase